jgi:hypothetical protein
MLATVVRPGPPPGCSATTWCVTPPPYATRIRLGVVAAALLVVAFSVCLSWVWTTLALLMKSPGVVLTAVIAPLAMRLLRTR